MHGCYEVLNRVPCNRAPFKSTLIFAMNIATKFWGLFLLMGLLAACGKEQTPKGRKQLYIDNYSKIVYTTYLDAYNDALDLRTAIHTFVDHPSLMTHEAAKAAWIKARVTYQQGEAFRFYAGPIDDADGPESKLNGWPMDEVYMDYVRDNQGGRIETGIVFDSVRFPNITPEVLMGANQVGGEKNFSVGYHAIEFLLWGQDFQDVHINPGMGGDRSYTDYLPGARGYLRRGECLKACADLLADLLDDLVYEWTPGSYYHTYFTSLEETDALQRILTGAAFLSAFELSGRRMYAVLEVNEENNPQEDEHSCFSDNTLHDLVYSNQSTINVLRGKYTSPRTGEVVEGMSFIDIIRRMNAQKADELEAAIDDADAKMRAIPSPFDVTITYEDPQDEGPVLQAVHALRYQAKKIAECAELLGMDIYVGN